MYESISISWTVSRQKVENVVYDPIKPVDNALNKYGWSPLGIATRLVNQPSKKAPVKLIISVPNGNSLPHIPEATKDRK